jgi:hypothetical protein
MRVLNVQAWFCQRGSTARRCRIKQALLQLGQKPDNASHAPFAKLSQSPNRDERWAAIGVGLWHRSRQDQFPLLSRLA